MEGLCQYSHSDMFKEINKHMHFIQKVFACHINYLLLMIISFCLMTVAYHDDAP